ncbi:hypothetical protein KCU95_g2077, partial [Aureobasidium melanogenum]
MSQGFTPVNGGSASQVEDAPRARRRSPKPKDLARMQKKVKALKESFARDGDLAMPQGITTRNAVIANILENGVPEAQSHEKRSWTADEKDFVWHALDWDHGVIAAYLGRTELACRLRRHRVVKERRSRTQRGTRATQNAALQLSAPAAGPSRSIAAPGASQESEHLVQMSREELPRWRSWSPLPPIGSPCDPEHSERQNVKPAPMEPPAKTTFDMQAAATKGSAPANHVTRASGLDILAEAAAQLARADNIDSEHDID